MKIEVNFKMFENKKNVFWEALLVTLVVFILGLLLGVAFEGSRLDTINEYYAKSELSIIDMVALNNLINLKDVNCDLIFESNVNFANKIYEEAILLERYEQSGKITDDIKLTHKKYDLLRTFLWINLMKAEEKCSEKFPLIVYLYEYEPEELTKRATQKVWSKVLMDLKEEKGDEIILISIAVDNSLISLNSIINKFNISELPVVIVNNEHVVEKLSSSEELKKYLDE